MDPITQECDVLDDNEYNSYGAALQWAQDWVNVSSIKSSSSHAQPYTTPQRQGKKKQSKKQSRHKRDPVVEKIKTAGRSLPLDRRVWGGLNTNILANTARWTTRYGFHPQHVLQNKRTRKRMLSLSLPRAPEGLAWDSAFSSTMSREGITVVQVAITQVSKRIIVRGLVGKAPTEASLINCARSIFNEIGIPAYIKNDQHMSALGKLFRQFLLSYMVRIQLTETEKQFQDEAERAIGTLKDMANSAYRYADQMGSPAKPDEWLDCIEMMAVIHNHAGNPAVNEGMPPMLRSTGNTPDVSFIRFAFSEPVEITNIHQNLPLKKRLGRVIGFARNVGSKFCLKIRMNDTNKVIYRDDAVSTYHCRRNAEGEELVPPFSEEDKKSLPFLEREDPDATPLAFSERNPPKQCGNYVGAPGRAPIELTANSRKRRKPKTLEQDLYDTKDRFMHPGDKEPVERGAEKTSDAKGNKKMLSNDSESESDSASESDDSESESDSASESEGEQTVESLSESENGENTSDSEPDSEPESKQAGKDQAGEDLSEDSGDSGSENEQDGEDLGNSESPGHQEEPGNIEGDNPQPEPNKDSSGLRQSARQGRFKGSYQERARPIIKKRTITKKVLTTAELEDEHYNYSDEYDREKDNRHFWENAYAGRGYQTLGQWEDDPGYGLPSCREVNQVLRGEMPNDHEARGILKEEMTHILDAPPGIDDMDSESWTLVSILDHKMINGDLHLLCSWSGLDPETGLDWDDTWEPLFRGPTSISKESLKAAELGEIAALYIKGSVPDNMRKAQQWAKQYLDGGSKTYFVEMARANAGKTPNNTIKFGVRVPKGLRQALAHDAEYDNDAQLSNAIGGPTKRWIKAVEKEMLKFFMFGIGEEGSAFREVTYEDCVRLENEEGYQRVRTHWVFDVKADGTWKARFVAGGDTVDSYGIESSMTMVRSRTVRIMFTQAAKDMQRTLVGDLGNAYLHSYTEERVWCHLGDEWDKIGHGNKYVIIVKAIYGLVGSAHAFHQYVTKKMLALGYQRCEGEPDVWLKQRGKLYDRVGMYVDDVVVCSTEPEEVIKEMSSVFTFKFSGEAERYLGADVKSAHGVQMFSSESYIREVLNQFQREKGDEISDPGEMGNLRKETAPIDPNGRLECDDSELLNAYRRRSYQRYMGIAVWIVQLGRIDICYATQALGRYTHAPREGHMKAMRKLFGFLKSNPRRFICVNPEDITGYPDRPDNQMAGMRKAYPWAHEERSTREPKPLGKGCQLSMLSDASHGSDKNDYRSVTGMILFYGSTPIFWRSKRQTVTAGSTFEAEYIAMKNAVDEVMATRFLLRSLGIPVVGATPLYGDNLGMIQNACKYSSPLKKKHLAICYHRCREAIAAGIVDVGHIDTGMNLADICTKALTGPDIERLANAVIPRLSEVARIMDPNNLSKKCKKSEKSQVE